MGGLHFYELISIQQLSSLNKFEFSSNNTVMFLFIVLGKFCFIVNFYINTERRQTHADQKEGRDRPAKKCEFCLRLISI